MGLSSFLILMSCYLLIISSVQGLSQLEFETTTSDKACISDSNAFVEYSQPTIASCFKSCASGPHYVEHYEPGYFYWPQIKYKNCDGMTCGGRGRCIPTRSHRRCHIVCVYKCGGSGCTFIGTQYVTYTEHLDCQCECQQVKICSHGYVWNTRECRCIKCPPGFYDHNSRRCLPHTPI